MKTSERKSIRPLNLRRIVEVTVLAVEEGHLSEFTVSDKLSTSERQARAILLELTRMNLLDQGDINFSPTTNANRLLSSYEDVNWSGIHEILYENYDFYHFFINGLSKGHSMTKEELLQELSGREDIIFNNTAIDLLSDWSERLGQVQRNLYDNRYYLLRKDEIDYSLFLRTIEECYSHLNVSSRPGVKIVYVDIAKLRESTCEQLKISRELFDSYLKSVFRRNIGKMDLSGAPLTTSAKDSPTSLKMLEIGDDVLSPQYRTVREGKGLEVGGKLYHYIGVFRKLG